MAEATTMGDLFGESSGDDEEEVVAPAASVPEPPKARRRIIADDEDDEDDDVQPPAPPPPASMGDLFGEDSDAEPAKDDAAEHKMADLFGADSDEEPAKPASKHLMEDLFGDDDDNEEAAAPEQPQRPLHPKKRVIVKGDMVEKLVLPATSVPSATAKAVVLRVPKFVAFESEPWDPDKPQKDYDEGQAVLRWRLEKDILTGEALLDDAGKPKWTSNGRLVRWSDGSLQLIVGNERYDVVERPLKSERLCLQAQPRQGAMCLIAQKALETEMRLRPPSLTSEAHKAFSLRTKKAVVKAKGVKEFFATTDPEQDKRAREKQKDEEIRREARRKQREARGNYTAGYGGSRAAADMNRAFMEDDEPGMYDDVGDVGAIKKGSRQPASATNSDIFGDSDEEEDDGGAFDSRMKASGRGNESGDDDPIDDEEPKAATRAGIFGDSDSDGDAAMAEAPAAAAAAEPVAARKRRVIADDDDEDM